MFDLIDDGWADEGRRMFELVPRSGWREERRDRREVLYEVLGRPLIDEQDKDRTRTGPVQTGQGLRPTLCDR